MRRFKLPIFSVTFTLILLVCSSWGFLVHRTVNQLAIYQLPRPMQRFFWKMRDTLVREAPRPDVRRNTDPQEAPRHFIDIEAYGDSAAWKMPLHWDDAVRQYTADTLKKYGFVPYEVQRVAALLTEAFRRGDRDSILYYATDLGHYIGDANVPLHSSINYDGQLTGQRGLHSLWESRIPELDLNGYRLRDGHKARYLHDPAAAIWTAVRHSYELVKDVLEQEREASKGMPDSVKYHTETRNGRQFRTYTNEFVKAYAARLGNTVNEQLLRSADLIADFWYTAWVDAGTPDLDVIIDKKELKAELKAYRRNKLIEKKMLIARQSVSSGD
ncbi:MAG TPA: zinc dependent phospholipase C family protein [Puia sp.]